MNKIFMFLFAIFISNYISASEYRSPWGTFKDINASGDAIVSGTITGSGGIIGTLSTASQTNVTSLGTLTLLQVDNLNLNTNTIGSTSGGIVIAPFSGQGLTITVTTGDIAINTSQLVVKSVGGKIGIGTTNPQRQLSIIGDLQVTGNIYSSKSGIGSMFVSGNSTATNIVGSWTTVTVNMTLGDSENSTMTDGIMTLANAGKYKIDWNGYISSKTAGDDLHFAIGVNGSSPYPGSITESTDAASTSMNVNGTCIVTVTAGQSIRFIIRNITSADRDCTFEYFSLNATKQTP